MALKLGMNGKLYYEDGGYSPDATAGNKADLSGGAGTVVDLAKDVTLNLETGESDVTTRGNNGWRARVATLRDGGTEFQVLWDPDSTVFQDLISAWLTNDIMGFAVLDEVYLAETGAGLHDGTGTGLVTNFSITNFTREEALEEAMMANVTIVPTYSTVTAGWLDRGGYL